MAIKTSPENYCELNKDNITLETLVNNIDDLIENNINGTNSEKSPLNQTVADIMLLDQNISSIIKEAHDYVGVLLSVDEQIKVIETIQDSIESSVNKLENIIHTKENLAVAETTYDNGDDLKCAQALNKILYNGDIKILRKLDPFSHSKAVSLENGLRQKLTENCSEFLLKRKFEKCVSLCESLALLNMKPISIAIQSTSIAKMMANQAEFATSSEDKDANAILEDSRKIFDLALKEIETRRKDFEKNFGRDSVSMLSFKIAEEMFRVFLNKFLLYKRKSGVEKLTLSKEAKNVDLMDLDYRAIEISFFFQEVFYFEKSLLKIIGNRPTDRLLDSDCIWPENLESFSFKKIFTTALLPSIIKEVKMELFQSYVPMEKLYLEESVAVALPPISDAKSVLSVESVEDFFYLCKKIILRALSTYNAEAISAVITSVSAITKGDVKEMLSKCWGEILSAKNTTDFPAERFGESWDETFWTKMNILCMVNEYFISLMEGVKEKRGDLGGILTEKDDKLIEMAFEEFKEAKTSIFEIERKGLSYLSSLLYASIEPFLDQFGQIDFSRIQEGSMSRGGAILYTQISNRTKNVAEIMSQRLKPKTTEKIITELSRNASRRLEKVIFESNFNIWGAMFVEREILHVASYLTKYGGSRSRSIFNRLKNITSALQLQNKEDVADFKKFCQSSTDLDDESVEKILRLRIDL